MLNPATDHFYASLQALDLADFDFGTFRSIVHEALALDPSERVRAMAELSRAVAPLKHDESFKTVNSVYVTSQIDRCNSPEHHRWLMMYNFGQALDMDAMPEEGGMVCLLDFDSEDMRLSEALSRVVFEGSVITRFSRTVESVAQLKPRAREQWGRARARSFDMVDEAPGAQISRKEIVNARLLVWVEDPMRFTARARGHSLTWRFSEDPREMVSCLVYHSKF